MHTLKVTLLGTFAAPIFFTALAPILVVGCLATAILCAIVFPVMGIFFPKKLRELSKQSSSNFHEQKGYLNHG